jgi:hypothetical protein
MTISLHLLARSRFLRAMGVLAWLMLVATSLTAAPLGMEGHTAHSTHAVIAAVGEHCHHGMHDAGSSGSCCDDHAGCCGGQAGLGCHCASMCSSALPTCSTTITGSSVLGAIYGAPARISAPSPATAPPLRPPTV